MSFESEKTFSDFFHFPRGIRRSGLFSIKESALLEECGTAMYELYTGTRQPADDVEKAFVAQVKENKGVADIYAKVFKKYLHEISPKKTHNLTASSTDEEDGSYDSGDVNID